MSLRNVNNYNIQNFRLFFLKSRILKVVLHDSQLL